MASEVFTSSGAGAVSGSQTGSAWGPWGAAIGAIVGGILGGAAGKKKKKAKKFAAKAAEVRRKQQNMQLAIKRRDTFRQMIVARANTVAAGASDEGVISSSVIGSANSINSQGASAVKYFDKQVEMDELYQQYAKKAGKYLQQADDLMGLVGGGGGFAQAAADIYGLSKQTQTPQANTNSYTSFNNTAAVTNMQNNSAFTSFGSSLDL